MDRKTITIFSAALAALAAAVAVLLALLFGGGDDEPRYGRDVEPLYCAVPSNAVALMRFPNLQTAAAYVLGRNALASDVANGFAARVSEAVAAGRFPELSDRPVAVSLHYSKTLTPLYVFDAGKSGDESCTPDINTLSSIAKASSVSFLDCDCSRILSVTECLRGRRLLLVSASESLVKSAERSLNDKSSIYDADGFPKAAASVSDNGQLLFSASDAAYLLPELLSPSFRSSYAFLSSVCGWTGLGVYFSGDGMSLSGTVASAHQTDFIGTLSALKPSSSEVFRAVPSTTLWLLSLPINSLSGELEAYDRWLDINMKHSDAVKRRSSVAAGKDMSPEEWAKKLKISEVASLKFRKSDRTLSVNLIRSPKVRDTDSVTVFGYPSYLSALFGEVFAPDGETSCFCRDGWMATGSAEAVGEYVLAMEYPLYRKLSDAGLKSSIPSSGTVVSYFSADQDRSCAKSVFSPEVAGVFASELADCDIMPMFLNISGGKKEGCSLELSICRADMKREKAPVAEPEVKIEIPSGPFTVVNCATGKNNTLVQNANFSISLKNENSKGVWTVPFSSRICGAVCCIDYFANGKIQYLFASGSRLHLLDRLGRFVSPFPVDLGKEILLGPAVYDFSGSRRYNAIVLHCDNTLEMYNLKGEVPEGWKGIRPKDRITALPERVVSGSKSFWIVRTSRETLVYPFLGGEPLTGFSGDSMLRPDTEVSLSGDGATLTARSYNGKTQKIKL